jgi:hypothetical protein
MMSELLLHTLVVSVALTAVLLPPNAFRVCDTGRHGLHGGRPWRSRLHSPR